MALPYIVFVTSEGCSHCRTVKEGGVDSPYYKAVKLAQTFGNVVIINTRTLSERPELPYVPSNLYRQIKGYPSVFLFSATAWEELWHNPGILGYSVRDWVNPVSFTQALQDVGYQPAAGGKVYGGEMAGEEQKAAMLLHGVSKTPAGFKPPVSTEITHVKSNGTVMPLREFIVYSNQLNQ